MSDFKAESIYVQIDVKFCIHSCQIRRESQCVLWSSIVDILGDFPAKPGFQGKWLTFKSLFAGHEILAETNPSRVGGILRKITTLVGEDEIKPVLDPQRFGFSSVGAAHDYAETKSPTGKVVLIQDLC